ncbi:DUF6868 family protein [Candidatus Venteria ishoeyi]|uniref:DUF6868 domain-containing protein n=1 Tax=Candidatus Venteria ishoeyi TaxID=1899563 RepID=A0A1H6FEM2_9GAMM|nr:hypothetical protein [Candidatus Venteria ishoeyi]MDM8544898.1 hypothetical protein [Candidatus Venteria ishoeyi]SEH08530.1 Uncharacterised protein [Candidatus Venteria ishoeyi]
MNIELLQTILGWCAILNIAILLWWFLFIVFARDWVYRMHSRWFTLSQEQFNTIHYAGIALFKILVLIFNVMPYLVLRFLI